MMVGRRHVLALLAALCVFLTAGLAPARAQSTGTLGKVYLMRGLANVFSYGMDDLAAKLVARGIDAQVFEHGRWPVLADQAVAWSRGHRKAPVIIIGHSLGADAAITMAERMTSLGIPPRLVITFDPVGVTSIGAARGQFINYFQSNNGFGKALTPGPGFKGRLTNRNLDGVAGLDHFNIDKSPMLHAEVVNTIYNIVRIRPRPAPAPVATPIPDAVPAATPVSSATPPAATTTTGASAQPTAQSVVH